MAKTRYQPVTEAAEPMSYDTTPPTHLPIAIYYRQSTEAQIGNISTTLQTVDMVKYLKQQGWHDDGIIMIDMDAGVSGTKKIDERPGMRRLFGLITQNKLGSVACQDEDRLFRDVTQIQVNIFIEACRAHRVLVMTPTMVYNFAHEQLGSFHARQFRFKCEMAAEYITTMIKGKLMPAKRSLLMNGKWAGSPMPVGFMADIRKKLPNGSPNENWKRFDIFEPYACVIREYYQLFLAFSGNASKTLRYIKKNGPYFPDPAICLPPEGYKAVYKIQQDSGHWCIKAKQSFIRLLTNATYIGHWVVNDAVIIWNNHPPIVDEATFYRAFNYLSEISLDGSINENYRSVRANVRPTKDEHRLPDRPLFAGLMFSPWEGDFRQVSMVYRARYKNYYYTLIDMDGFGTKLWLKKADLVDASIAALLIEKLRLTFNYQKWEVTVDESSKGLEEQQKLKEAQIKQLDTVMENLIVSLASLSTPDMIVAVEKKYQEAQAEHDRLQHELLSIRANVADVEKIRALKHSFSQVVDSWQEMPSDEKRAVVHGFVDRIIATEVKMEIVQFVIYWRDGSTDTIQVARSATGGTVWLPNEIDLLLKLIESGSSRVEIAKAFPDRPWRVLYCKYRQMTGKPLPREHHNTIRKYETYNEYIARMSANGHPSSTSEPDSITRCGIAAALTAATAPATSPR